MKLTRIIISLIILLSAKVSYALESPPYAVPDPAISEDLRLIYYNLDRHKHNNDDSSRLDSVIPSSPNVFSIGNSTNPFQFIYVSSQVAFEWLASSTTQLSSTSIHDLPPASLGALAVSDTYELFIATALDKAGWRLVRAPQVPPALPPTVDVTTGAASIWLFNEGSGNSTYDSLVSTRVGQILTIGTGNTVWITTGINNSNAISFGASTGSVVMSSESWSSYHQGNFTSGIMSTSLWVYPRSLSSNRHIFAKRKIGQYEFDLYFPGDTTVFVDLLANSGAGVSQYHSSGAINQYMWNQIVVIFDKTQASGAKTQVYVNNNKLANASTDVSGTTAFGQAPMVLGFQGDSEVDYCDCIIDNLRIYPRRLAADEINLLFNEKTIP